MRTPVQHPVEKHLLFLSIARYQVVRPCLSPAEQANVTSVHQHLSIKKKREIISRHSLPFLCFLFAVFAAALCLLYTSTHRLLFFFVYLNLFLYLLKLLLIRFSFPLLFAVHCACQRVSSQCRFVPSRFHRLRVLRHVNTLVRSPQRRSFLLFRLFSFLSQHFAGQISIEAVKDGPSCGRVACAGERSLP